MVFPRHSGFLLMSSATESAAPPEIPMRIPSVRAHLRAVSPAASAARPAEWAAAPAET